jgi:hypothetical protein
MTEIINHWEKGIINGQRFQECKVSSTKIYDQEGLQAKNAE